jgi:hypothetical protein
MRRFMAFSPRLGPASGCQGGRAPALRSDFIALSIRRNRLHIGRYRRIQAGKRSTTQSHDSRWALPTRERDGTELPARFAKGRCGLAKQIALEEFAAEGGHCVAFVRGLDPLGNDEHAHVVTESGE